MQSMTSGSSRRVVLTARTTSRCRCISSSQVSLWNSIAPRRLKAIQSNPSIFVSNTLRRSRSFSSSRSLLEEQGKARPASEHATHILPRSGLLPELEDRGFVQAVTSEDLASLLDSRSITLYSGVDPSAQSLHVGNLLPLMCLLHFQRNGHRILALIGGATGSIGDPSGRSTERNALSPEVLRHNVASITSQVERFFERGEIYWGSRREKEENAEKGKQGVLQVVNNRDWYEGVGVLDFLRDVGKYARVNTMLSRDSVKNRLASDSGISFTEFSYQLLQANDFKILHERLSCQLQVGGSDQWGNIVAGIDLIKRTRSKTAISAAAEGVTDEGKIGEKDPAFGLTIPLLTTSSGEKFGKSAGNAIWLDEEMTSVFDFYQYFLRTPDSDVGKLLRLFTFLPLPQIDRALQEHTADPQSRSGQRLLANEVTELVHGPSGLKRAQVATRVLFESSLNDLNPEDVLQAFKNDPRLVCVDRSEAIEVPFTKLAAIHGLIKSRAEANRAVSAGGFYVNGSKIKDKEDTLKREVLIGDKLVVIGVGKSEKKILYLC